jgi:hypothetical protein
MRSTSALYRIYLKQRARMAEAFNRPGAFCGKNRSGGEWMEQLAFLCYNDCQNITG